MVCTIAVFEKWEFEDFRKKYLRMPCYQFATALIQNTVKNKKGRKKISLLSPPFSFVVSLPSFILLP